MNSTKEIFKSPFYNNTPLLYLELKNDKYEEEEKTNIRGRWDIGGVFMFI